MSLHLWGRMSSINVRKVVLCAQVLGLPLPRTDAGLTFGVVNTDGYRRLNPNGLVPLLDKVVRGRGQVFMTCTEENWPRELGGSHRKWGIESGALRPHG